MLLVLVTVAVVAEGGPMGELSRLFLDRRVLIKFYSVGIEM